MNSHCSWCSAFFLRKLLLPLIWNAAYFCKGFWSSSTYDNNFLSPYICLQFCCFISLTVVGLSMSVPIQFLRDAYLGPEGERLGPLDQQLPLQWGDADNLIPAWALLQLMGTAPCKEVCISAQVRWRCLLYKIFSPVQEVMKLPTRTSAHV